MKIINREEFLKLPKGTVFSNYEPCVFEDLCIKEESLRNDFLYSSIVDSIANNGDEDFSNLLYESVENGIDLSMDFEIKVRDGFFEEDQLFAVWNKEDVQKLIIRLQECLTDRIL